MPSTYTTRIRLEKQADGENPNSWGTLLNQNVIDLIDQAIGAYTTVALSGVDVTLTTNNGSSDQARSPFLELAGTVSTTINVILPNVSKSYLINNKLTYQASAAVIVRNLAGQGFTAPQSGLFLVVSDGVSCYTFDSSSLLSTTNTFTGQNTFTSVTNLDGAVSVSGAMNIVGAITAGSSFAVSGTSTQHQVVGAITTLTDAASVAVDMSLGNNFFLQLTDSVGASRVVENPTHHIPGQTGQIYLIQSVSTAGRTASFGSFYKFQTGTAPTLTTSIGSVDLLVYNVRSSTAIDAAILQDFK